MGYFLFVLDNFRIANRVINAYMLVHGISGDPRYLGAERGNPMHCSAGAVSALMRSGINAAIRNNESIG